MFKEPIEYIEIESSLSITTSLPSHATLFNPTVEQVNAIAAVSPELFIFIFVTNESTVTDWSGLVESNYVLRPVSLENIHPWQRMTSAIEIIRFSLSNGTVTHSGDALKPV